MASCSRCGRSDVDTSPDGGPVVCQDCAEEDTQRPTYPIPEYGFDGLEDR